MSGAVRSETIRCVAHSVNRFMLEIATTPQEFRARYERAVPFVPKSSLAGESFNPAKPLPEVGALEARVEQIRLLP
jgi:hypothetical protein